MMPDSGLICKRVSFQHPGGAVVFDCLEARFPGYGMTLVTGPTGIGKSTLLHLLGGLLRPTTGKVLAGGEPVSRWRTDHKDRWRRLVGYVFQHLHLINELTVLDNIMLPLIPLKQTWSQCLDQAGSVLDRLDLSDFAAIPIHKLSGGQRQRAAVARAMVHQPHYLLLDEPSGFQDDHNTRRMLDALAEEAAQGACIVVCSHDRRLMAARSFFHQMWRLDHGRLRSDMDPSP